MDVVGLGLWHILSVCSAGTGDLCRVKSRQNYKVLMVMQPWRKPAVCGHSSANRAHPGRSITELECSDNMDNRSIRKLGNTRSRVSRYCGTLIYEMVQSIIERRCRTVRLGVCKPYLCAS